jgi:hypothetical protein
MSTSIAVIFSLYVFSLYCVKINDLPNVLYIPVIGGLLFPLAVPAPAYTFKKEEIKWAALCSSIINISNKKRIFLSLGVTSIILICHVLPIRCFTFITLIEKVE